MTITRSKIGYTNDTVTEYRSWNPFGFGCSGGCDGCWSRQLAKRMKCPECRAFEVHMHSERLVQPRATKTGSLVLANFTNDWQDRRRQHVQVTAVHHQMRCNRRHHYITLTKQAERLRLFLKGVPPQPHIWHGLTLCNQAQADAKLPEFLQVPGNLWLSLEPLWGEIKGIGENHYRGVIVGHDNRRGAPGTDTLEHVYSVVEQCVAAGLPVMAKQLWQFGKLLRCSKPDEYAKYPSDLKHNALPWTMPGEKI